MPTLGSLPAASAPAGSDIIPVQQLDGVVRRVTAQQLVSSACMLSATGLTANGALATLPANAVIAGIYIANTTANAVLGGVNIGTSAGASDIAGALIVGANGLLAVPQSTLLKAFLSASGAASLFISAVTAWNGASLNVRVKYDV